MRPGFEKAKKRIDFSAGWRPLGVVVLIAGAVVYYIACVAPTREICDVRKMVQLTRADLDALQPGALVKYPTDNNEKTRGMVAWVPEALVNGVHWFALLSDGTPTAKPVRFEFLVNNGRYSSPSQVLRALGLRISPFSALGNIFSTGEVDARGRVMAQFGSVGPSRSSTCSTSRIGGGCQSTMFILTRSEGGGGEERWAVFGPAPNSGISNHARLSMVGMYNHRGVALHNWAGHRVRPGRRYDDVGRPPLCRRAAPA